MPRGPTQAGSIAQLQHEVLKYSLQYKLQGDWYEVGDYGIVRINGWADSCIGMGNTHLGENYLAGNANKCT